MADGGERGVIRRNTLRQQIADALRDEVLAGRLPSGHPFTVKEIAEQYGVSATPVREALLDLCAQGLLDVEQHRGFKVHAFTADDYRAMVEARALVVEGIFRSGAGREPRRLPTEMMVSIRRRAEEAERAARAGDLDVLIGYDLRFWRELGSVVGNAYISDFLDRMRVQTWMFAVPLLRRLGDLRGHLWHDHGELVTAVARHDLCAAQRLVTEYHEHSLTLVRKRC
ncbi:GntR family transcriptional regulator [Streptomyces celluloflavus]|uniref:GntR family transcriptional regulator n=2 Tax=Streptomyces TaxID=1883 RepID=A0A4Q9HP40_STRKA|nr:MULTISPECIES: GntR family transcriptional regulator [Streptomyces]MYU51259.1 GntR family transcriptional regulator [Streptomyces sp. SID7805]TBO56209.1 GntR family transcriptional regulator [Streptomyces kasugaensis]